MDPETDGDGAINLSTHQQPEPRLVDQQSSSCTTVVSLLFEFDTSIIY